MSQDQNKRFEQSPEQDSATGSLVVPGNDADPTEPCPSVGSADACPDGETRVLNPVAAVQDAPSPDRQAPAPRGDGDGDPAGPSSAESAAEVSQACESDEPFDSSCDESAELAEVIARDERKATLPQSGNSSVAQELGQRPPRLAKAKRGPRTVMLEELIPEVVIPTDSLETRGFSKVRVIESSKLEELKAIAQGEDPASQGQDPDVAGSGSDRQDGDCADSPNDDASSSEGGDKPADEGARKRPTMRSRSGRPRPKDRKGKSARTFKFRASMAALAAVVLLVAVLGGVFAWDRWYRFDDAQDILGEWKMANAERTMVITDKQLKIAEGVSYDYTLDTKKKTITYSFGSDKLTASYRFSPDRQYLIIDESGQTDWLVAMHLKEDPVLADRDVPSGVSKLSKLSSDTEAEPKDTEEIREDESIWTGGVWVDGYFDYKRPELKDDEDEEEAKKKKKKESQNGDDAEEDEADEYDDGAAYVDEETGNRFYYDSTQVLYYDIYGNYYYDMYGNNPYTQPAG